MGVEAAQKPTPSALLSSRFVFFVSWTTALFCFNRVEYCVDHLNPQPAAGNRLIFSCAPEYTTDALSNFDLKSRTPALFFCPWEQPAPGSKISTGGHSGRPTGIFFASHVVKILSVRTKNLRGFVGFGTTGSERPPEILSASPFRYAKSAET